MKRSLLFILALVVMFSAALGWHDAPATAASADVGTTSGAGTASAVIAKKIASFVMNIASLFAALARRTNDRR